MSDERRRDPRFDSGVLGLIAYDSLSGNLVGSVANLSAGGMMMNGRCDAEVDGTMQLSLARAAAPDTRIVELVAQVAWKTGAATPGSDWIGVRIADISSADARILLQLCGKAESSSNGKEAD